MNLQSLKNRNVLLILICVIAILLIYSTDLFKLTYRLTGWNQFKEMPIPINEIQYFIADTPNVLGFKESETGEPISCATTVAYIKTAEEKTYRCCETADRVSCLAGDFSSDIPVVDEQCTTTLREIFGIPATLEGAREYAIYGNCPDATSNGALSITAVKMDDRGRIFWKFINASNLAEYSNVLKCILAPLLLLSAIWLAVLQIRRPRNEPPRRF